MLRATFAFALLVTPALAADPTFSRDEVQAAYALGRADAMREQLSATPAARSMAEKLKPPPTPPAPK